jgi:hypothetical protein
MAKKMTQVNNKGLAYQEETRDREQIAQTANRTVPIASPNISTLDTPTSIPKSGSITSDLLASTAKPYILPPTTPLTMAQGTQDYIASQNASIKSQRQQQLDAEKANLEADKNDIASLIQNLGNSGQMKEQLYKEGGVDKAREQVDDYTSQLEAEQASINRRVQSLQKNKEGLFAGGVEQEVNRIQNESLSKQADIAILQNAALRKYSTASEIADRQLEAKLEPMKAKLDALKFFYTENKADFNKQDDRLYSEFIKEQDRVYEEQKEKETANTELLKFAINNEAPPEVIKKAQQMIKNGADVADVAQVLGQYGENPEFNFEKEKFALQYNLDLEKFNFDQQQALIENQADQNKPLTTDELLKFGGLPAGTTWGDVIGAGLSPEKPPTDDQRKAAGFADRVTDSSRIFDTLENKITKIPFLSYKAQISDKFPNFLRSAEVQQQLQAERNFINAILRRESGAVISPDEFTNARMQYFPQPGDKEDVLKQKKANRERVLGNLAREAGSAYSGNKKSLQDLEGDISNSVKPTGMRTDRHNNPAAFTVDIAKQAGLVLGKDYSIGDSFPNNPNLKTAKLIGNPIAQTIKVIDKIGFYTQSGNPRWTYVPKLQGASNWKNLSYDQKKGVIKQMYAHEGGSQLKQYFA